MLRFAPWMALGAMMPLTGREGLGDGFGLEPAGLRGQPAVELLLMMGKGRPESKMQILESGDVIRVNNRPVADTFPQTGFCREPHHRDKTGQRDSQIL